MNVRSFEGPQESIYVLGNELVITISLNDTKTRRSLPNEWVYVLKRQEIEDVVLENNTLVLHTKDKRQTKVMLFEADKAFLAIKEWIKKDE
ncbi:hypothetical protein JHC27_04160 [archaeon]|jgi:hypothetical protein|nr:hypothetical protein [archaeon]